MRKQLFVVLGMVMAAISTSQPAAAQTQDTLALDRYNPSWAGDRFFATGSPYAAGHLDFHGGVLFDYAHNPLVLQRESGNDSDEIGAVVAHQLFLHVNTTFSLWRRLAINLNLPIALFQAGDDPVVGSTTFASPDSPQVGDLRIGLRGRIWGEHDDIFQIGVGASLWAPTGSSREGSFVSSGKVRGLPQVIVGGTLKRFVWSFDIGPEIRASQEFANTSQGTMLSWNAAGGALLGDNKQIQVGAEVLGNMVLSDISERTVNVEALIGGKWRFVDYLVAGAAVGPGLAGGVGTPDVRAVLSFAYSPNVFKPKDSDGDGIVDDKDACPQRQGIASPDPRLHGCPPPPPPPDSDGDGIIDAQDACPQQAGPANADKTKHGCPPPADSDGDGILDDFDACPQQPGLKEHRGCPPPPDGDGDGIIDSEDACPQKAGPANTDKTKHGCPLPVDTDGDGIVDKEDACPKQAGKPNKDPKRHGCPKVIVTGKQIVIFDRIEFASGRSVIRPGNSQKVVAAVAKVLKEHPEIMLVEVQGHTDNRGSAQYNRILSRARAKAVVNALVRRGIKRNRMVHKGFGPDKPVADNSTKEGQQKNRRVQFIIRKRKAGP